MDCSADKSALISLILVINQYFHEKLISSTDIIDLRKGLKISHLVTFWQLCNFVNISSDKSVSELGSHGFQRSVISQKTTIGAYVCDSQSGDLCCISSSQQNFKTLFFFLFWTLWSPVRASHGKIGWPWRKCN